MHRLRPWLAGLACLIASHTAQADRSRLDAESEVVEAGDCAAEWALERQHEADQGVEHESTLELDCGIGWRTEVLAAFSHRRGAGERVDTLGLEALTSLRDRGGDGRIGWALAYGLAAERAGAWRYAEHFVAIEASWQPDPAWLLQARLGTLHDHRERRDATPWTLTLQHALSETTELSAELEGDDRRPPLASVAARFGFGHEDWAMQWSYAASLGGPRERRIGLAISVEF